MCEIAINLLKGVYTVNDKDRKKLKKYKNQLRKLASSKRSLKSKRRIIQSGGALVPLLVSTLLSSAVGAIINHVFNKDKTT